MKRLESNIYNYRNHIPKWMDYYSLLHQQNELQNHNNEMNLSQSVKTVVIVFKQELKPFPTWTIQPDS